MAVPCAHVFYRRPNEFGGRDGRGSCVAGDDAEKGDLICEWAAMSMTGNTRCSNAILFDAHCI